MGVRNLWGQESLEDSELTREMIPDSSAGHGVICKFAHTLPADPPMEEWREIGAYRGEIRSVSQARKALFIIFRVLRNEILALEEDPDSIKRVGEILDYLRANAPILTK